MSTEQDLTTDKVPVQAPEPDEATELLRSLIPELSDSDEQELADRILHDHQNALQDRGEWETRLAEWEDAYHNRVSEKTFPWRGASNFHVPVTMSAVEVQKPRLVEGILGLHPPIVVIPSKGADEHRKDTVEAFLNWQVLTELPLEELVHQSAHLYLQPGLVVAKVYWKVSRTTRRMIREFPLQTPLRTVLESLFGSTLPEDLTSKNELEWTGTIPSSPQGGPPLEVSLQMKFLEDTLQVLVEKEEVTETPAVDLIDPIDLVVPVKGGEDINALPWCQLRLWYYENDLREKVTLGRFSAEIVQALLDQVKAPHGDQPSTDSGAYRAGKSQSEGVEDQGPSNVRRTQYEILEDYRRWDINGDGIDEEIIVWIAPELKSRILGWDYLDNVYAHGRRPIRVGRFLPIPFRFYPLGVAEMVKGIQDEINAIHNQKVDYATIQNLPFYFYRASATIPSITQTLKPGSGVPIDNPHQDILFPKWGGSPAFGAQEEATLYQYVERLLGLTDLSFGRQPNRVGATRTARGTQTLLAESGLRFKMALQGFQRFWAGIFTDILALDQEYLPPNKEFRVTGRRPPSIKVKDRMELRGRFDLRLASTVDSVNREQLRDDATILMQALLNPAAIQAGLVGMKGLRRIFSDFLKAFGKDPDFYLEEKAAVRSPEEELMIFTTGQYISPVMGEDTSAHLQAHQAALQDSFIPPEVKSFLSRHIQETLQLLQAQRMAQMLQQGSGRPPVGPQAVNAEQGKMPQAAQPTQMPMLQGGTNDYSPTG